MTPSPPRLRVAFRADAAIEIGTGHVMRCLTLATALRDKGADCVFLCRPHPGHLMDVIAAQGFATRPLPQLAAKDGAASDRPPDAPPHAAWLGTDWARDARDSRDALDAAFGGTKVDWLIVDHYGLDAHWERAMRGTCLRMMVIDDLADRPHDCDLLLDQSLGRGAADYAGLIPAAATALTGPRYALLRPEFARLRAESLARRTKPKLERLLVTLGGVDKDNVTTRVLDAIAASRLPQAVRVTVVMGPCAPWLDTVRARAAQMRHPTEVLVGVRDMARLMTDCDLAIGAGGTTTWERCALGLPSFTMVLARNQMWVAKQLHGAGATVLCHDSGSCGEALRSGALQAEMTTMSRAAAAVTDGEGTSRVVQRIVALDV